jgi:CubicO group peptidase (beta-lactamase class C family)
MLATRLLCLTLLAAAAHSAHYPGAHWENRRPAGWSAARLQAARDYSTTVSTAAVMVVQDGFVVNEWGETSAKFRCHSMRKSLLSALYGIHVKEGRIKLSATLASLGIDDNEPGLSAEEKLATVHDLLKARSGIYHPALYETAGMKAARPARYSHPPGTFWYYNNWDFNALGTIFEKLTGARIFQELERRIARPLQMEDFRVADGEYVTGPDSVHSAYPLRMTARDLARFGYLFLRQGKWRGKQIIPKTWVRESTTSYSNASRQGSKGDGYGYMWWVRQDSYSARGAGGHYVVVIPRKDLVVVHRVNTDVPGNVVTSDQFGRLLDLILAAAP